MADYTPENRAKDLKKLTDALVDASKAAKDSAEGTVKLNNAFKNLSDFIVASEDTGKDSKVEKILQSTKRDSNKEFKLNRRNMKVSEYLLRSILDATLKASAGQSNLLSFWKSSGNPFVDVFTSLIGSLIQKIATEFKVQKDTIESGLLRGLSYQEAVRKNRDDARFTKLQTTTEGAAQTQLFIKNALLKDLGYTKEWVSTLGFYKADQKALVELSRLNIETLARGDKQNAKMLASIADIGIRSNLGADKIAEIMKKLIPATQHLDAIMTDKDRTNFNEAAMNVISKTGINTEKGFDLINKLITDIRTGLVAHIDPSELLGKSVKQQESIIMRAFKNMKTFMDNMTSKSGGIRGGILSRQAIQGATGFDLTSYRRTIERALRVDLGPKSVNLLNNLNKRAIQMDPTRALQSALKEFTQGVTVATRNIVTAIAGQTEALQSNKIRDFQLDRIDAINNRRDSINNGRSK